MFNPRQFAKKSDIPNYNSMFGNIGNSWDNPLPNDLYIKGVPKTVVKLSNFVGNVGLGLDTLLSFTFPANTFRKDQSDYIKGVLAGGFGTNNDDKRIQLSFGGNVLFNTGLLDLDDFGYFLPFFIIRLSDTQFNFGLGAIESQFLCDSGTPPTTFSSTGFLATARNGNIVTLSGGTTFSGSSQTFLFEAESAAAVNNNIILNAGHIDLIRF